MTLEQLHKAIKTGRRYDDEHIWYEDGEYWVTSHVLAPLSERVYVDTVGGYKQRHGLDNATGNADAHQSGDGRMVHATGNH